MASLDRQMNHADDHEPHSGWSDVQPAERNTSIGGVRAILRVPITPATVTNTTAIKVDKASKPNGGQ